MTTAHCCPREALPGGSAALRGPHRVGGDALWTRLLQPGRLANGTVLPYALGLMHSVYRGLHTLHHGGTVLGGQCQMLTVPTHGLDIVIMANGAPAAPRELAHRIIDAVLAEDPRLPVQGVLSVDREAGAVRALYIDTLRTRRLALHRLPAAARSPQDPRDKGPR